MVILLGEHESASQETERPSQEVEMETRNPSTKCQPKSNWRTRSNRIKAASKSSKNPLDLPLLHNLLHHEHLRPIIGLPLHDNRLILCPLRISHTDRSEMLAGLGDDGLEERMRTDGVVVAEAEELADQLDADVLGFGVFDEAEEGDDVFGAPRTGGESLAHEHVDVDYLLEQVVSAGC